MQCALLISHVPLIARPLSSELTRILCGMVRCYVTELHAFVTIYYNYDMVWHAMVWYGDL